MTIKLPGFENWIISTVRRNNGGRWADVYQKVKDRWKLWGSFESIDRALDMLIHEGMRRTEQDINVIQETS